MSEYKNHLGQPIGFPVADWQACMRPPRTPMTGRHCRLEALDADTHAQMLYQAYAQDKEGRNWTYLPYGPFAAFADFDRWLRQACLGDDPLFHAIIDPATASPLGVASFMRIEPATGVIEVGHIHYSPLLQGTIAATEAMYLMMRRVFDELNYRRYEWKCDALNAGSRKAASRLGFEFEGIFRQATIYKDRNRDTAWYSIIDQEWPLLKKAFEQWLDPGNFDAGGGQRQSLAALIDQVRRSTTAP